MGRLQNPMISAVSGPSAAELLARERQSRREGSGIQLEQLPGCWMLQQTWNRNGEPPAPGTAALLRWLQASLILNRSEQGLRIVNQVALAGFRLRFSGHAQLKGSRPLLMFSFTSLELSWSNQVLLQRSLPSPKAQRLPFFALIELNEQQGTLTARGRGGGLAQWSRLKQEAA